MDQRVSSVRRCPAGVVSVFFSYLDVVSFSRAAQCCHEWKQASGRNSAHPSIAHVVSTALELLQPGCELFRRCVWQQFEVRLRSFCLKSKFERCGATLGEQMRGSSAADAVLAFYPTGQIDGLDFAQSQEALLPVWRSSPNARVWLESCTESMAREVFPRLWVLRAPAMMLPPGFNVLSSALRVLMVKSIEDPDATLLPLHSLEYLSIGLHQPSSHKRLITLVRRMSVEGQLRAFHDACRDSGPTQSFQALLVSSGDGAGPPAALCEFGIGRLVDLPSKLLALTQMPHLRSLSLVFGAPGRYTELPRAVEFSPLLRFDEDPAVFAELQAAEDSFITQVTQWYEGSYTSNRRLSVQRQPEDDGEEDDGSDEDDDSEEDEEDDHLDGDEDSGDVYDPPREGRDYVRPTRLLPRPTRQQFIDTFARLDKLEIQRETVSVALWHSEVSSMLLVCVSLRSLTLWSPLLIGREPEVCIQLNWLSFVAQTLQHLKVADYFLALEPDAWEVFGELKQLRSLHVTPVTLSAFNRVGVSLSSMRVAPLARLAHFESLSVSLAHPHTPLQLDVEGEWRRSIAASRTWCTLHLTTCSTICSRRPFIDKPPCHTSFSLPAEEDVHQRMRQFAVHTSDM